MTTPTFSARPSDITLDGSDFGPDYSDTPSEPPRAPGKSKARETAERVLNDLGKNSPTRSGVRKLTNDDRDAIAGLYRQLSGPIGIVRPQLAVAMREGADECATAWCNLAEKNVKVRQKILAVLEGGEWGKLIFAHMPLIIAVLPEDLVRNWMLKAGSLFAQQFGEQAGDES